MLKNPPGPCPKAYRELRSRWNLQEAFIASSYSPDKLDVPRKLWNLSKDNKPAVMC
jgi:hypothetical protein